MRKAAALILFVSVLTVFGCKNKPNIVGTWHSSMAGSETTYHFRADGGYSLETLYDGTRALSDGKYHIDDSKLYLDPATSDVQGGPHVDEVKSVIMQPSHVTIKMQSPTMFQLGLDQPPLILMRSSEIP